MLARALAVDTIKARCRPVSRFENSPTKIPGGDAHLIWSIPGGSAVAEYADRVPVTFVQQRNLNVLFLGQRPPIRMGCILQEAV
jgi:hypothetical protein